VRLGKRLVFGQGPAGAITGGRFRLSGAPDTVYQRIRSGPDVKTDVRGSRRPPGATGGIRAIQTPAKLQLGLTLTLEAEL
jgi:hypothetical protein